MAGGPDQVRVLSAPTAYILTDEQFREVLTRACNAAGGQAEFSRWHGLNRRYLNNVVLGRCAIPLCISRLFGYERVTAYRKVSAA